MKVIGLTDQMRSDVDRQCAAGFRAWLAEVENGTWGSWEELLKFYPKACRTGEDEAHFPLAATQTGVIAGVFFHTRLILLRCIAPAPLAGRIAKPNRVSLPPPTQKTRPTAHTL